MVKVFLKYQVGRDKKWGRGEGSLANQIIEDIDILLEKLADDIVEDIEGTEKEGKNRIRMEVYPSVSWLWIRYLKYLTIEEKN